MGQTGGLGHDHWQGVQGHQSDTGRRGSSASPPVHHSKFPTALPACENSCACFQSYQAKGNVAAIGVAALDWMTAALLHQRHQRASLNCPAARVCPAACATQRPVRRDHSAIRHALGLGVMLLWSRVLCGAFEGWIRGWVKVAQVGSCWGWRFWGEGEFRSVSARQK